MKKSRYNEIIARKQTKLQQRRNKRYAGTHALSSDTFLQAKAALENMVNAHNCFLSTDGLSVFGDMYPTENFKTQGMKKTAELLDAPYKSRKYVRGARLTRAERKQAVHAVMHETRIYNIVIAHKQVGEIIKAFCPCKPRRTKLQEPIFPSLCRKPRWVNDMAELVLTYVQFGSGYPTWSYYTSGRIFKYEGMPSFIEKRLKAFVNTFSKSLDWDEDEFDKDPSALRAEILKRAEAAAPTLQHMLRYGDLEQGPYLRAPAGALDVESAARFSAPVSEGFLPDRLD